MEGSGTSSQVPGFPKRLAKSEEALPHEPPTPPTHSRSSAESIRCNTGSHSLSTRLVQGSGADVKNPRGYGSRCVSPDPDSAKGIRRCAFRQGVNTIVDRVGEKAGGRWTGLTGTRPKFGEAYAFLQHLKAQGVNVDNPLVEPTAGPHVGYSSGF